MHVVCCVGGVTDDSHTCDDVNSVDLTDETTWYATFHFGEVHSEIPDEDACAYHCMSNDPLCIRSHLGT